MTRLPRRRFSANEAIDMPSDVPGIEETILDSYCPS